ncbi:hypothetical protein HII31_13145 [Pseudocercospora fuligena]|uniref:Uncharacterized protein n=1 Tax=Pseudocercospora fuligena TaxID=685502 RepID=A0A8H6R413_9PEZI|nr:hypothetical protein HII31_13145 [Pseudocercospora fuligena]
MLVYNGRWDTGHDEPPHQVDIPSALQSIGVAFYDRSRAYQVYMRYISGRDIYDRLSIREMLEICRDRRISLRSMPDVFPGPISHPWVQESFRRLHTCLIEALEKSETATTFKRFLDLPTGLRFRIYRMHFDQLCDIQGFASLVAPPAITEASHMVRRESLPIFFNYSFLLRYITKEPTIPADFLPPPGHIGSSEAKIALQEGNKRFIKAPPSYTRHIRRLVIKRLATADYRADRGIWQIDLDAAKDEDRVCWIAGEWHGMDLTEKDLKKVEKFIADGTSRLQKCVGSITMRDGMLVGSDAAALKNALENIKK